MASKAEIENYIFSTIETLGHFQHADPAIFEHEALQGFIDAGYALLEYYQTVNDTVVEDAIIGAYVDCTLLMGAFSADPSLTPSQQQYADGLMGDVENLVNAITAAVEQNISANR